MLYALPQRSDRGLALEVASAVAKILKCKVVSDRKVVIGEPQCHYAVRLNTRRFWFGARFSQDSYVVQGTHKRAGSLVPRFYASLKVPNEAMLARVPLEHASAQLGIRVYVSDIVHGPVASEALCSKEVRQRLAKLDFSTVQGAFVSPLQLRLIGKVKTPSHAAEQILAQRELLECLGDDVPPPNTSFERTREG